MLKPLSTATEPLTNPQNEARAKYSMRKRRRRSMWLEDTPLDVRRR